MKPLASPALGILLGAIASCLPASASACAACFGKSDAPMAQGMNMAIFTLLLIITSVLIGIATFFGYIIHRAARLGSENSAALGSSVPPKPAVSAEAHTI
jgi:hypothetical protein